MKAQAKITNRRNTKYTQNGISTCDVTCPECARKTTVSYGGWTAIACGGCGVELHRFGKHID